MATMQTTTRSRAWRRVTVLAAVAAAALCGLCVGCATTNDVDSELPWNTPAAWEGQPAGMQGINNRR